MSPPGGDPGCDKSGIELDRRPVDPVLRLYRPDRTITMPADRGTCIRQLTSDFPRRA